MWLGMQKFKSPLGHRQTPSDLRKRRPVPPLRGGPSRRAARAGINTGLDPTPKHDGIPPPSRGVQPTALESARQGRPGHLDAHPTPATSHAIERTFDQGTKAPTTARGGVGMLEPTDSPTDGDL